MKKLYQFGNFGHLNNFTHIILYSSSNEHGAKSNETIRDLEGDNIYETELALAPFWYQTLALVVLSVLGVVGVLLNGFVIGCFAFCPIVSRFILVSTQKNLLDCSL